MVFQTLNKLKWTNKLERCMVTIVSRGSPGDFVFNERGKETFIHHHRVKRIRINGETIWRRNSKKGCFGPFAFLRKTCR